MSCESVSMNSQINNFSEENFKGFLNKIKNDKDETVGYLFGTLHFTPPQMKLDEKIIKKLSNCQTLFLEMDIFDKQIALENYKKKLKPPHFLKSLFKINDQESLIDDDKLLGEINLHFLSEKENPTSAETHLCVKAELFGLKIQSLETPESREAAKRPFEDEMKYLRSKCNYLAHFTMNEASKLLLRGCQSNDLNEVLCLLKHGVKFLNSANQYLGESTTVALEEASLEFSHEVIRNKNRMSELIKRYEDVFTILNNKSIFAELLEKNENNNKDNQDHVLDTLQLGWKIGSEKMLLGYESFQKKHHSLAYSKFDKLIEKMHNRRDEFMAEQIHNDLMQMQKKKRNFYAIGSLHVLGKTKDILKEKGWRIENAYDDFENSLKNSIHLHAKELVNLNLKFSLFELDQNLSAVKFVNSYPGFKKFEQSILDFSLIKTLTEESEPEIAEFLHLPEMDSSIVRECDMECISKQVKKLKDRMEKTFQEMDEILK